ncbi:unnamed protein product [Citrullus colocynthis]|uniref:Uncharacterized protein n=1 Tax=Citrullus colocynthis TaxID=252529 RepID=A0ABP0Z4U0_9ROSI
MNTEIIQPGTQPTIEGQRQQAPPSSDIANPTVPNATVNTTNVSLSSESTPTSIDKLSHGEEVQYEKFSQVFPCGLEVLSQPNVLDPSASVHICFNPAAVSSLVPVNASVVLSNKTQLNVHFAGTVCLPDALCLKRVLYVPHF